MFDKLNKELLQQLKGNVEWIHCDSGFGNYLRLIARVDSHLIGLSFSQRSYAESSHSRRYQYKDIVIDNLPRKTVLGMVAFLEIHDNVIVLTESEKAEWQALCEQEELENRDREQKRAERKEREEKAEYERLREKYERANAN